MIIAYCIFENADFRLLDLERGLSHNFDDETTELPNRKISKFVIVM